MSEPVCTRPDVTEQILAIAVIVLLLSLAGQLSALPARHTDIPAPAAASAERDVAEDPRATEASAGVQLHYSAGPRHVVAQVNNAGACRVSHPCLWRSSIRSRGSTSF